MSAVASFWHELAARPDFWGFISIPIVAALVTWAHVWCAIQMVFYPLEFVGLKTPWLERKLNLRMHLFGWQGIIPRKARKMSDVVVDRAILRMGSVSDFLREMEPAKIGQFIANAVEARVEEYTDEVMCERNRVLWENLPMLVRRQVYRYVRRNLPEVMDGLVRAVIDDIERLVDVKRMCGNQMEADRSLIVRIFQEVGDREFRFIVNSSFWIGLAFGVVQMALFYFLPWHGMLPLYAAILGWLTNWLALAMIFRPLNPLRLGPFTFQGLFLRRQEAVSDKFAELTSQEMLTVAHFMREMLTGERSDRTRTLIRRHIAPLVDASPLTRTAVQLTMGPAGYSKLKSAIANKSADMALDPLADRAFNRDRALALARLLAGKMKAMAPVEFQDLLRPAFQEDEWILLVLGGVTGLVAGTAQLLIGFA